MKPKALEQRLRQFSPSPERYEHPTGMTYTKGVLYIIETHDLRWLVDAIANHQLSPAIALDPEQWSWQSWELSNAGHPLLNCFHNEEQQTRPAISQELWSNDFPLKSLKLLVINRCLMLPSEREA